MIDFFQEGGLTMWLVLLVGMAALGLAVTAAVVAFGRKRSTIVWLGALSLLGALLTAGAGVGGYFWGMSRAMAALANVDPSQKATILAVAISEAMNNILLGLALAPLPALVGTAALVRGLLLPHEDDLQPPARAG